MHFLQSETLLRLTKLVSLPVKNGMRVKEEMPIINRAINGGNSRDL